MPGESATRRTAVSVPPIDDLLDRQAKDGTEGGPVRAEVYLERHPGRPEDGGAVEKLIANEAVLRKGRGEAPAEEEYRRRFPGHADWIAECFRFLRPSASTEPQPRRE